MENSEIARLRGRVDVEGQRPPSWYFWASGTGASPYRRGRLGSILHRLSVASLSTDERLL